MDVKQAITSIIAAHKAIPLVNTPQDVIEAGELLNERSATMKVFNAGNGQRTAHIYACPIHFKDIDGKFKTIDPTVKHKPLLTPLQTHQYEVTAGAYHAHFKADKPHDYRLEVGDSWIEYEAQFVESESLTIKVETSNVGVKETITLLDNKAPTKLAWRVTREGTGIIMPPPTAHDANGKDVLVAVEKTKDTLIYYVGVTGAVFPIEIDPTSVMATNDGIVRSLFAGESYTVTRDKTAGDFTAATSFTMGQNYTTNYYVFRAFASFVLSAMSSLSAASLFLNGRTDESTTDFGIYLLTSTYSNPLVVADFDQFDGWQASGAYNGTVLNDTWNSSSYSADWNEIVFNAAGLAAILAKQNDTFKLVAISKEDYDNSEPTGPEDIRFESSLTVGEEPYLSITYTASSIPIMTESYRRRRI